MFHSISSRPARRLSYYLACIALVLLPLRAAAAPATTVVSDVIYRADGTPAAGTLLISWPAFTTADTQAITAGSMSVSIGPFGAVTLALAPNQGATPAGTYYKVVLRLDDGTSTTEYWSIPTSSPVKVGMVRSVVVPQAVAVQTASRQYVDTALAAKASDTAVVHKDGDEQIAGVKLFAASPLAPAPESDSAVATKSYVDSVASSGHNEYVNKAGDSMTGPLTLSGDPVNSSHASNRHYVDLQVASLSAGLGQKLNRSGDTPSTLAGIRFAGSFAGADLCAKVAAAIADLPSTGGTVDARGLEGAQDCASNAFNGVTKPVTLLLGHTTITMSVGQTFAASGMEVIGLGEGSTVINYNQATGTAFSNADTATGKLYIRLEGFKLDNTSGAGATNVGVDYTGFSRSTMRNLWIVNFGTGFQIVGTTAPTYVSNYYNKYDHVTFDVIATSSGYTLVKLTGNANAQRFDSCQFHRGATQLLIGGTGYAANEINCFGCTFENAETVSVDVVEGRGILLSGGRGESNAIFVRTADNKINWGVTVDSVTMVSNTVDFSDSGGIIEVRGTYLPYGKSYGVGTEAAPNLISNATMEGWAGASDLLGWSSVSGTNWASTGMETQESTLIKSGTYSAKIGNGTNAGRGIATTNAFAIDATKLYSLLFSYATPADGGMRPMFRFYDSTGTVITTGTLNYRSGKVGQSTGIGVGTLSYNASYNAHYTGSSLTSAAPGTTDTYWFLFKPPSTATSMRLAFVAYAGTSPNIYAYVDNVYLAEGRVSERGTSRFVEDGGNQTIYGSLDASGYKQSGVALSSTHLSDTANLSRNVTNHDTDCKMPNGVYCGSFSGSAAMAATTLYTPSADGTYRITVSQYYSAVDAGNSGTIQPQVTYGTGYATNGTSCFTSAQTATSLYSVTQGTCTFHVGAGQPIKLATVFSSFSGAVTWNTDVVVEQLQ